MSNPRRMRTQKQKPNINEMELESPTEHIPGDTYTTPKRIPKAKIRLGLLEECYQKDWHTPPVSIRQFICSPDYLGHSTGNGKSVYPKWFDILNEVFYDNSKTLIVFSGATRTGKTTVSVISLCYIMYLVSILKHPYEFLGTTASGKFTIAFFNLTKSLSDSVGYGVLQGMLLASPWFRSKAEKISDSVHKRLDMRLFNYALSSPSSVGGGVVGKNILAALLDEVDSPLSPQTQKKKVLEAYQAMATRFEGTFVKKGRSLGKLFVVSSKQEDSGLIETFIADYKNSPRTAVYEHAQYEIKPRDQFAKKTFRVAYPSDAFHQPKILDDEEDDTKYVGDGYEILEVPMDFYRTYKSNLVRSLRDISGKSVHGERKNKLYSSASLILDCIDETKKDPVKMPTILMGLKGRQEDLQWYFDYDAIRVPRTTPRYIHMDFGLTNDALGLACSVPSGWIEREVENQDGSFSKQKLLVVETEWVFRIKAREGDEIPLTRINKFILFLKQSGLRIRRFTSDLRMASVAVSQIISGAGIDTEYLSVDKTPDAYYAWRDLVHEKRWIMHRHDMVLLEASNLEVLKDGKVDHPISVKETKVFKDGTFTDVVTEGSKDLTDAIAASVFSCLKDSDKVIDSGIIMKILNFSKDIPGKDNQQRMSHEDISSKLLDFSVMDKPKEPEKGTSLADLVRRARQ